MLKAKIIMYCEVYNIYRSKMCIHNIKAKGGKMKVYFYDIFILHVRLYIIT